MKTFEFIKKIKRFKKPYFTTEELRLICNEDERTLFKTIDRLVKNDVLVRVHKGVYIYTESKPNVEEIANQLYMPSYLSFESMLGKSGILNQSSYDLTFATTRKTKREKLLNRICVYSHIPQRLFYGYKKERNVLTAEPEKALVDLLYLLKHGKRKTNLSELYPDNLDTKKALAYAQKAEVTGLLCQHLNRSSQ